MSSTSTAAGSADNQTLQRIVELRFGPDNRFRVFYDVDSALRHVQVLAVGVKDRNRLLIGGEEYES